MIAKCLKTGLTVGDKIFSFGDVFLLPAKLEEEYLRGLRPDQVVGRQRRVYGKVIFAKASTEEVLIGLTRGQITMEDLSGEERGQVEALIKSRVEKRLKQGEEADRALQDLLEN
jgi:hypothetical protein